MDKKLDTVKLDAILACRVGGTRLYGKPLQFLDIKNRVTILEYLVRYIQQVKHVDSICLAIANGKQNYGFAELAERQGWNFVFGDEQDMLGRILKAAKKYDTDIALLNSSESPYFYCDKVDEVFEQMVASQINFSTISNLPDGSNFVMMDLETLQMSHQNGSQRNKDSVTSYVFDNKEKFKISMVKPEEKLQRSDIRITVDYPEDLVFCRRIYRDLKGREGLIKLPDIIDYWDADVIRRKDVEDIGVDWGEGRLWE